MEEATVLQQLTERVNYLEAEVSDLRHKVEVIETPSATAINSGLFLSREEKRKFAREFDRLFAKFGIDCQPIGAEKLQEMMKEANLEPNELSRDLIAMRDE